MIAYSFRALMACIVPVLAHVWLGEPIAGEHGLGRALMMRDMVVTDTQAG